VRLFENRMQRGAFGAKRDEVTGGWRELHNEELHNMYSCRPIGNLTFYIFYAQRSRDHGFDSWPYHIF
jgi:hypothetical protein